MMEGESGVEEVEEMAGRRSNLNRRWRAESTELSLTVRRWVTSLQ